MSGRFLGFTTTVANSETTMFGRFLSFSTNVENSQTTPTNLTEGKFRSYWDRTDKCSGNEP